MPIKLFDDESEAPPASDQSQSPNAPVEDVLSGNPMDAILEQHRIDDTSQDQHRDMTRIITDAELDKLQYGGEITNANDLAKLVQEGQISDFEARILANRLGISVSELEDDEINLANSERIENQIEGNKNGQDHDENLSPALTAEEREHEEEIDASLLTDIGELERREFSKLPSSDKSLAADVEGLDMGIDGHGPSMGQQPDVKAIVAHAMGSTAVMGMDAATGAAVAGNLEQAVGESLVGHNTEVQTPEAAAEVSAAAQPSAGTINLAIQPVIPQEEEKEKEQDHPATVPFNPTFASVLSNAGMGSLAATIGKLSFTDLGKGAGALFTDAVMAGGKDMPVIAKIETSVPDLPPRKVSA